MGDVTDEEILEGALNSIIEQNPELLQQALKGMFEVLDQHSVYFSEEEFKQFAQSMDGTYGGLGITVENSDGYVTIMSALKIPCPKEV